MTATLHLMVGRAGVGKTTLARTIAAETGALRLTPDEWMNPLFGESDAGGKRDVLEGRLIWVASTVVRSGGSAILDFGCWSADERYAVRDVARLARAAFVLHALELDDAERLRRIDERWRTTPDETFELGTPHHAREALYFEPPDDNELMYGPMPPPPTPFESWAAWASDRWPSLPRLDLS